MKLEVWIIYALISLLDGALFWLISFFLLISAQIARAQAAQSSIIVGVFGFFGTLVCLLFVNGSHSGEVDG